MEPNTPHSKIQENVAEAIQNGRIPMRSSLHFIVKSVLVAILLSLIFVLSSVIVNYIIFSIHVQSHHELLGFGVVGFLAFLHFFPWLLLTLDIGFVILVVYLLRSFRFGYKTPILYLGGALIFLVLLGGFLVERVSEPLNTRFMRHVDERRLPQPFPYMMRGTTEVGEKRRPLCRCEIVTVTEGGMIVARDLRGGRLFTFRIAPDSPYATTSSLTVGDVVIIAGNHDGDGDEDDIIDAYGLRKISGAE